MKLIHPAIRTVVLLMVTGYTLCSIRPELVGILDKITERETATGANTGGVPIANEAIDSMNKQNDLLLTWALAMVAGLTALLTTTKVHRTPLVEWAFILLAPAAVFVGGSLVAGLRFQQRMAYLRVNGPVTAGLLDGPIRYLGAQNDFLRRAVFCLGVFGAYFLIMIVWGKTRPMDEAQGRTP
jgi:hypothetical protein